MDGERIVAGLACSEVLEDLSSYLDGELPAARREDIESHLRACDTCERFGREMAATVAALRRALEPASPADRPDRTDLERETRLLTLLRRRIGA